MLKGKKIILGVCGGISAYKSALVCRGLKKIGCEVIVVMTKAGTKFITPLTMETLSGNEVITELFPKKKVVGTRHITLADWADLILVAPATANIIGKIKSGIADDILTTVVISTKSKVLFAPAMNVKMWDNPIVQQNISELKKSGYGFIQPGIGDLACGDVGKGRMAEPEDIIKKVIGLLSKKKDFEDRTVLVTAGRTEEPLDPVRYISNRSSGKMGYAVAEKAKTRGAEVILISGPSSLNRPLGIDFVQVRTAKQMRMEVKKYFKKADCLVMTAAVSDFSPEMVSGRKLKRADTLTLKLKSTPGILEEMGKRKGKKVLVGFSLETEDEVKNAKIKLKKKNLDLIVVNNPKAPGAGFELDTNVVSIIDKGGKAQKLPLLAKTDLADKILDRILSLLKRK